MAASHEYLIHKLLVEYSDRLEDTLILAITLDRDVVREFDKIRADLQELAATAAEEEASGFDHSGLTTSVDLQQLRIDHGSLSSHGTSESGSWETVNATTMSDSADFTESVKWTEQSNLADEEKVANLHNIFGNFPEHTIRFVLRNVRGNVEFAFDELLSRQFRQEEGTLPMGVDGFAIENIRISPARERARPRKEQTKSSKVLLDYQVVSPTVDEDDIEGMDITGKPGFASAKRCRATANAGSTRTGTLAGSTAPQSAHKPSISLPSTEWQTVPRKEKATSARPSAGLFTREESGSSHLGYVTGHLVSDRAEQHVNRQSTPSKIDLHGVTVMDGVRIAKSRVKMWWDGLGEEREKLARYNGLYVVTGIGRHSLGGVSRLRQAVGAALRNDGWRFETLTGEYYITGRAR